MPFIVVAQTTNSTYPRETALPGTGHPTVRDLRPPVHTQFGGLHIFLSRRTAPISKLTFLRYVDSTDRSLHAQELAFPDERFASAAGPRTVRAAVNCIRLPSLSSSFVTVTQLARLVTSDGKSEYKRFRVHCAYGLRSCYN